MKILLYLFLFFYFKCVSLFVFVVYLKLSKSFSSFHMHVTFIYPYKTNTILNLISYMTHSYNRIISTLYIKKQNCTIRLAFPIFLKKIRSLDMLTCEYSPSYILSCGERYSIRTQIRISIF